MSDWGPRSVTIWSCLGSSQAKRINFCVFHAIVTVDFRGVTGHFKNIVTDDFRNSVTGFG